MSTVIRHRRQSRQHAKTGGGFVNSLINKLPFELHLPTYQYCGPGTKLQKRLARGDAGINPLDAACKVHDIAYEKNKDLTARHKADYELEQRAWERVKSKDAGLREKADAWLVTNIMKAKRHFGMGCKSEITNGDKKTKKRSKKVRNNKMVSFRSGIVRRARDALQKAGGERFITEHMKKAADIALHAAKKSLKTVGGKQKIRTPRIIPIPKVGGILPLLPIFAGLSALGTLAGGAAGVAKVIHDVRSGRQQLAEAERHNRNMEAIAIGKSGKGIHLKPYRSGLGLYLKPYSSSKN